MTADDYVDYELQALQPVTRYQGDLATVVDTVESGSIVGKIYSWYKGADGVVWWMLYDTYEPGKNMYVKHDPDKLKPIVPGTANVVVNTPGLITDLLGENPLTSVTNFFKSGTMLLVAGGVVLYLVTRRK